MPSMMPITIVSDKFTDLMRSGGGLVNVLKPFENIGYCRLLDSSSPMRAVFAL
jgi:hypothetical protein